MNSFDSFFFHEDSRGLSLLYAGIPGYSVLISPDQLKLHHQFIAERNRHTAESLDIRWFGPRPENERPVIAELWAVVGEYCRRKPSAADGPADSHATGGTNETALRYSNGSQVRLTRSRTERVVAENSARARGIQPIGKRWGGRA